FFDGFLPSALHLHHFRGLYLFVLFRFCSRDFEQALESCRALVETLCDECLRQSSMFRVHGFFCRNAPSLSHG
ncbi:hypothetical protein, partial [Chromobacterium haemolyticum]|uniref:hypothetical protein n=1 Tax=Chromobacterium haemolyticum TaxID=394935 RepID=UPI001C629786